MIVPLLFISNTALPQVSLKKADQLNLELLNQTNFEFLNQTLSIDIPCTLCNRFLMDVNILQLYA